MTHDRAASDARGLAFPLVVIVLIVGFSLPIVLTDHLPMQDIPNHLAIVRTLAAESTDPMWGERFENNLGPDAYSAYYFISVVLAEHVDAEAANRIVLTLYAVFLPLAFLALVLAYDPGRRWSVIPAFLLIYSDLYLVGFTNYLLAMPMLFAGAAVGVRIARSDGTSWWALLALAALGVALYLAHPFALAMLLVVLSVLVFSRGLRARRLIALWVGFLPGLILALLRLSTDGVMRGPFSRVGLGLKIRYLITTPFFALDAHQHWTFYVALGLGILFAGLVGRDLIRARRTCGRAGAKRWWRDRPLAALALFVGVYFAAPFSAATVVWLDLRLAVATWLLLLLALKPRFTRGLLRRGLLVAMCGVSLLGMWSLHQSFDREIAPLFDLIGHMRPSSRVLAIAADRSSQVCRPFYYRDRAIPYYAPYAHFGAYYNVEKGGESPFMTFHATLDWIPLRLRDPFYARAFRIEEPFLPSVTLDRLPITASRFDYIIVRGLHTDVVRLVNAHASPEARAGDFGLFVVRKATPPG